MTLLNVNNVGKSFREYRSEWRRFARWFSLPMRPSSEAWGIRGVNFTVQPGESVGVVGINGAGKSTLLKIIAGTLQPTEGQVEINGLVAAILELGMGFDPELSGRQNARYGLGLMGLLHAEIEQLMPRLEEFAEIGDYFDEPVRTYSTGMQMRVAFAVVTARRPDLLIVDEALSVGDMYFQQKCMAKIREFQRQGTSLLLVTHDPGSVRALCDRAVLLDSGSVIKIGDASETMDYYQSFRVALEYDLSGNGKEVEASKINDVGGERASHLKPIADSGIIVTEDKLRSASLTLFDEHNKVVDHLVTGKDLKVQIDLVFDCDIEDPHVGLGIRNKFGEPIYETNTYCLQHSLGPVEAGEKLSVTFSFKCDLGHGLYHFVLGVTNKGFNEGSFEDVLFYDQNITPLKILPTYQTYWDGYFNLRPDVMWRKVKSGK